MLLNPFETWAGKSYMSLKVYKSSNALKKNEQVKVHEVKGPALEEGQSIPLLPPANTVLRSGPSSLSASP